MDAQGGRVKWWCYGVWRRVDEAGGSLAAIGMRWLREEGRAEGEPEEHERIQSNTNRGAKAWLLEVRVVKGW